LNYECRPRWARYGVTVRCVALGWLAREALTPAFGTTALPFIFLFPAVAIAAWFGGLGAGALATILSAAAADWFFIEPVHSWSINNPGDIAGIGAFLVSCAFIVGATEEMLLRTLSKERSITAIAISGYCSPADIARTRAAGFAAHLAKPFNLDEFDTTLAKVASQHNGETPLPKKEETARNAEL
jgi:K+-sensing histidine kinase KdpD